MSTYSEKLRHPSWQKKRLEILSRDNWTCVNCSNQDQMLHVHHIFYDSQYQNPWDYPDYCLIVLCAECHASEHDAKKQALLDLQHQLAKSGIRTADQFGYLESVLREEIHDGVFK
jgi:5-methylcytosine-specific restriction endonuclease McrA